MILSRDRKAALALFCVAASFSGGDAFVNKPFLAPRSSTAPATSSIGLSSLDVLRPQVNKQKYARPTTALRMSSPDWDQMKYTEAAWGAVSSLTKVADYYQSSAVEAPLLLDVLLNPSKHNAGEDAESAQKVVQKVLEQSGVSVKELRSSLETHLSKQAKMSAGGTQNVMGRDLPKVFDSARTIQSVLGVSEIFKMEPMEWKSYVLLNLKQLLAFAGLFCIHRSSPLGFGKRRFTIYSRCS